ncbi:MAG: transglycosylase SLT domain-containing protein [Thermoplasmata archaeon]
MIIGMLSRTGLQGLGQTPSTASIQQMIVSAANQYGVPVNVALGIASHESQFQPNAVNSTLNSDGTVDYGLFQLNTLVLQTYGLTPAQALDPQTNINTAMSLLGGYINKYGDVDTALQAYASGAGAVAAGTASPTASGLIPYINTYQVPVGIDESSDTSTSTIASTDPTTDDEIDNGTILGMDPTTAALVGGLAIIGLYLAT